MLCASVAVYPVSGASAVPGVRIADTLPPPNEMLDETVAPSEVRLSENAELVTDAGAIASENVAWTVVDVGTPVAPFDGTVEDTVGGLMSTVQARSAGVGSLVPPLSVARTCKLWEPAERPL